MFDQSFEKFNYDIEHDVLYVFIAPPRIAYEDEVYPGIFLRKDDDTDEVLGAIIMGYKNIDIDYLSKIIPIKIDFNKINKSIKPLH